MVQFQYPDFCAINRTAIKNKIENDLCIYICIIQPNPIKQYVIEYPRIIASEIYRFLVYEYLYTENRVPEMEEIVGCMYHHRGISRPVY